jgi:hypothetical protein
MKNMLKQVLGNFGFELKRTNFRPDFLNRIDSNHRSKGLIVEFIGPSGVGKTTFFNQVFRYHWNDWFSKSDLVYLVNSSKEIPFTLINNKAEIIYSEILKAKYNILNNCNISLEKKTKLHDFFVKELEYDAFIRFFNLPKGLFSEDGLTHNFQTEIIDIHSDLELYNTREDWFRYLFFNRSIIYLEASPDFIVNNLKKRSVENPNSVNDWYSFYGPDKIIRQVEKELLNNEKIFSIGDRYGASFLKLNIETETLPELIEKVNNFLTVILDKNY